MSTLAIDSRGYRLQAGRRDRKQLRDPELAIAPGEFGGSDALRNATNDSVTLDGDRNGDGGNDDDETAASAEETNGPSQLSLAIPTTALTVVGPVASRGDPTEKDRSESAGDGGDPEPHGGGWEDSQPGYRGVDADPKPAEVRDGEQRFGGDPLRGRRARSRRSDRTRRLRRRR